MQVKTTHPNRFTAVNYAMFGTWNGTLFLTEKINKEDFGTVDLINVTCKGDIFAYTQ